MYLAEKNGKIRIITVNGQVSQSLSDLVMELSGRGIEYRAGRFVRENGVSPLAHFMVVDGKRYRLEESHADSGMPETVKAEVCCNGPGKARQLLEFFEKAWTLLTPRQEAVGNHV